LKRVLSIAGFDPTAYAGVSADLKTFEALGVEGLGAVTALTVQDRVRVSVVVPVTPRFLSKEVRALLDALSVDAVKVGMLATSGNAAAVARIIRKYRLKNVVLDPVLTSSGGRALLDKPGAVKKLLPLVTVVTPNIDEAGIIAGIKIRGVRAMEAAAMRIMELGPKAVVIKGGHLKGAPIDLLYDGKRFSHFKGRRIRGGPGRLHGTGCIFSSAIAAGLARGLSLKRSVEGAKKYLEKVIKARG
jgi:hydroxymethylpyrimidine/phosphomethylpyrimidine kinase